MGSGKEHRNIFSYPLTSAIIGGLVVTIIGAIFVIPIKIWGKNVDEVWNTPKEITSIYNKIETGNNKVMEEIKAVNNSILEIKKEINKNELRLNKTEENTVQLMIRLENAVTKLEILMKERK